VKRAVIGIVFNPDQSQVLILKRRDVDVWVLPGGGVDENERLEAAVIREIQEETGLSTKIKRKVAEYTPCNRLAELTDAFECEVIEGALKKGEETRDIYFCPLTQLPKSFFFIHDDWLQDALKNSPEVIRKPIVQVTYLKLLQYFCRHPIQVIRFALTRLGLSLNR